MPIQVVTTTRRAKNGRVLRETDAWGGLFTPVPGKNQRPAYSYGAGKAKDVLFQCPVSAIPTETWELLFLWWRCRQLKTLPYAGGLMDQPHVVQAVFPIFEVQYAAANPDTSGQAAEQAAALAVGTMVKLFQGVGRR